MKFLLTSLLLCLSFLSYGQINISNWGQSGGSSNEESYHSQGVLNDFDPVSGTNTIDFTTLVSGGAITALEKNTSGWRTSNTEFTPTSDGIYKFNLTINHPSSAIIGTNNQVGLGSFRPQIILNGNAISMIVDEASGSPEAGSGTISLSVGTSDIIEFGFNSSSDTNEDFYVFVSIEPLTTSEVIPARMLSTGAIDSWMRVNNTNTATSVFDVVGTNLTAAELPTFNNIPSTGDIIDNGDGSVTLKSGFNYELEASIRASRVSGTTNTIDAFYGIHDGTNFVGALGASKSNSDALSSWGNAYHETGVLTSDVTYSIQVETADNTVTDIIKGSYFRVRKLSTSTVINTTDVSTNITRLESGYADIGDVLSPGTPVFTSMFSNVTATNDSGGTRYDFTFAAPYSSVDDYALQVTYAEKTNTANTSNDIIPIVRNMTASTFEIFIEESSSTGQDLRIYITAQEI